YVEPVFLLAEGVDIPQLQRVIVAIGDDISMQPTIEQAIFELFGQDADFIVPEEATELARREIAAQATGDSVIVDTQSAQQLDEIRSIWADLRTALQDGEYARYGELLNELDGLINNQ
ncbi:MAG: hypothetical protein GVY20_12600, partial [Bacteroidetes bacterium]|nr:hypothetical protein [Bacteroidota bacterium]